LSTGLQLPNEHRVTRAFVYMAEEAAIISASGSAFYRAAPPLGQCLRSSNLSELSEKPFVSVERARHPRARVSLKSVPNSFKRR
jgi:hypothetical protein